MIGATRLTYRTYRKLKRYFIEHPNSAGARLFFRSLHISQRLLSGRGRKPAEGIDRTLWKAIYFARYSAGPPFQILTAHPIAGASSDHIWPSGSIHDNTQNRRFNLKLYEYFGYVRDLRVLDLGCSGGAFVKSILEAGYTAVGLEGSDISRRLGSGEWDTIPLHLFTCDITRPFQVVDRAGEEVRFHCITAWEVLEHISEDRLDCLLASVKKHLLPGGIFVASVATFPDADPTTGAVYHVTVKPKTWWREKVAHAGFSELSCSPFQPEDYVRGHGQDLRNWSSADDLGFHLVLEQR